MVGVCFGSLVIISILCGILTGNSASLCTAALDGAGRAVELTLSLLGMMCLWNGIMEVLKDSGAVGVLSKIFSPLTRLMFPRAAKTGNGIREITAAMCANMLGIGNAATPLAISAMKALAADNPASDTATDDMVTFTVLGTCSIDLVPTTIIAMRHSAGSAAPYSVIPAVFVTSAVCAVFGVTLSRLLCLSGRKKRGIPPAEGVRHA